MTATVIGLGNDARRDDGAGLTAARALAARLGDGARVIVGVRETTELLEFFGSDGPTIVVDAVRSGRPPGTVVRWDTSEGRPFRDAAPVSTHGLSLPEALELAETLEGAIPRIVVYGIEAGELGPGDGLTDAVRRGVDEAVERIATELAPVEPVARRTGRRSAHA